MDVRSSELLLESQDTGITTLVEFHCFLLDLVNTVRPGNRRAVGVMSVNDVVANHRTLSVLCRIVADVETTISCDVNVSQN